MRPTATSAVAWSVCLSETLVSPAKTAEQIDMLCTWVGPKHHVLDGVRVLQGENARLGGLAAH